MRIAAIFLPELRIEWVRTEVDERSPLLAVVLERASSRSGRGTALLGQDRIDAVSREARALGILPGQTVASARARSAELAVRVVRADAVRDVLARLAEASLAFGATVSFAMAGGPSEEGFYGDIVWVDVTGCSHLHASSPTASDGEVLLATRLSELFGRLGHACAVAIADGPRIAGIVARATSVASVAVVPSGQNERALAKLSIACLPLAESDRKWLENVGVRTVAELEALPRPAWATRLEARARSILSLIKGDDRAPLTPYVPPRIPEEEVTLEYGVEGSEALTFVAKTLVDRLSVRLLGRAVAVARIELDLVLDRALCIEDETRPTSGRLQQISMDLALPLSAASDILAALRPKIERTVLEAPVLGAKLRAVTLVHKPTVALSLFEAQPKASGALPRLVAELVADLGQDAVGKLALVDTWTPHARSQFVRLEAKADKGRKRHHLLSSVPEPTRILNVPVPVARDDIKIVRHLSRLEAVDWWRYVPGDGPPSGVDYVYAWVDDFAAWVEIDRGSGAARIRGLFD